MSKPRKGAGKPQKSKFSHIIDPTKPSGPLSIKITCGKCHKDMVIGTTNNGLTALCIKCKNHVILSPMLHNLSFKKLRRKKR